MTRKTPGEEASPDAEEFQDNPLVKAPVTTDANEESGMAVAIDVAEASNAEVRLQPTLVPTKHVLPYII